MGWKVKKTESAKKNHKGATSVRTPENIDRVRTANVKFSLL